MPAPVSISKVNVAVPLIVARTMRALPCSSKATSLRAGCDAPTCADGLPASTAAVAIEIVASETPAASAIVLRFISVCFLIVATKIARGTADELPNSRLRKTRCIVQLAVGGDRRGAWCRVLRCRAGTCGERKGGNTCQDDMLEHRVHALGSPGFIGSDFHDWALTATSVAASRLARNSSLVTCSRLSDF
jgi:hypothetical protein